MFKINMARNSHHQEKRTYLTHSFLNLPVLLSGFTLLTFLFSFKFPAQSNLLTPHLTQLAYAPYLAENHLSLGQLYLAEKNLTRAQEELTIGLQLNQSSPDSQVLGVDSEFMKLKDRLETEPEKIRQKIAYWENIAATLPHYRDAWVQLLYLSYNEGDLEKSKTYLEKIRALDPNYAEELPKELKSLIN